MPPVRKYQKDDIINVAYEIAMQEGLKGINARRIAKELKCSIQPVFHNFATMEELESETINKIYKTFEDMIRTATDKEKPYLAKGVAYIKFAKDYPEFFKILFMRETNLSPKDFILGDKATSDTVIDAGKSVFGLSYEEQQDFHVKIWFLTHGIACLLATKTVEMSDQEIYDMLGRSAKEMLIGYKQSKGEK